MLTVSDYIDIFAAQNYPELFSPECVQALKIIKQTEYASQAAECVIHEVRLDDKSLTTDFSFTVNDEALNDHIWLEFDFENYSSGLKNPPCIFSHFKRVKNEEIGRKFLGSTRYERIKHSIDKLVKIAGEDDLLIYQIGIMNRNGSNYSDSIRVVIKTLTIEQTIRLLKNFSYTGDFNLIEKTLREIEPFKTRHFEINFELFPDGSISRKVGASFYPFTDKSMEILTNILVERSLCRPEKAQAIINWVNDKLPEKIYSQSCNHFKLQFESDKITGTKAYLTQSNELNFYNVALQLKGENFINFL